MPSFSSAAERPDVQYSLVAVDFMSEAALHAALSRVSAGLASGTLHPLPLVAHDLSAVGAALRQMSQARHVGKIVVQSATLGRRDQHGSGGSVAVTGGLGNLGTQVAEWLCKQQLKELLLLSRSGRFATSSPDLLQPSRAAYAALVTMAMCDSSTGEGVDSLLVACSRGRPLQGIMHAGGVLSDATLASQTLRGLRAVFGPKVVAAARLGAAVKASPPTFQVLFSSVASLLGSPGQSNYSAANAMLDAMAAQWQAQVREAHQIQCPLF
jgi:hypothetical protein